MFDSISSETFAAVLLIVVVFQLKRILVFFNLSKTRMRGSEWMPVLRARVPDYTLQLLESAQPGLAALGFELVGTQAYEPLNAFDPRPCKFDDFYWHPLLPQYAYPSGLYIRRGSLFTVERWPPWPTAPDTPTGWRCESAKHVAPQ